MSYTLRLKDIQNHCGQIAYRTGTALFRSGKVTIQHLDLDPLECQGSVQSSGNFEQVSVHVNHQNELVASCSCPTLSSFDKYCSHIAGVLLSIYFQQQDNMTNPSSKAKKDAPAYESELSNEVLKLFTGRSAGSLATRSMFDTREKLQVEFSCKPIGIGSGPVMMCIALKIGTQRLYAVPDIRDYLSQLSLQKTILISKSFTYDPEMHSMDATDEAAIQLLIQICRSETVHRRSSETLRTHEKKDSLRWLPVPPPLWDRVHTLLLRAPHVRLEHEGRNTDGISISADPLPLQFNIAQTDDGVYRLNVSGMERITVMESYALVVTDGKLWRLGDESVSRLTAFKQMLNRSGQQHVVIPHEQMEPFIDKVVPGLMKLGNVLIEESVSRRLERNQLQAKLYLDRVKDRLLAGLEFHYGDILINPMEETNRSNHPERILLRDGETEQLIMEMIEGAAFTRTESGFFMTDEDAEYHFLYHTVPKLSPYVQVYATSAVKAKLFKSHIIPKIHLTFDERTDWLEFKFQMNGIPEEDIRTLITALKEKRKYHRLANGSLLSLEDASFQRIMDFMNKVDINPADLESNRIQIPLTRGLPSINQQDLGPSISLSKPLRRLLEHLRNPDHLDHPLPENLTHVLRDYQSYGFQWLKTLARYGFGGILADDMGLGKSLMSIAYIQSVLQEIRDLQRPVLIVCPSSLLYNWLNEFNKFAPQIKVLIALGSKLERHRQLQELSRVDVIVTSYPLLRRDVNSYVNINFHTLFLDEAQYFKNHFTQTAQSVKKLKARHRFALTGTPVENRLEDLWSIYNIVFPGLLPDRQSFRELTQEQVIRQVRPFMLRRLKSEVLQELPDKIETTQASELLPEQKKLYIAYLAKLKQETVKHLNDEGFKKNRIKILAGITRLRQLCCHPSLFVEGYTGSSAKFEQWAALMEDCRNAEKRVLVFSQFTQMLTLMRRQLSEQGISHFYLDGETPAATRMRYCELFNEGERDVFLVSLKAGGTGLNLTGADTVILYDLWWNPAVEQQATDRAHRMGQQKVVHVIRLLAQGTIEDKMYELQQRKKSLMETIVDSGRNTNTDMTLTEEDIREMMLI
ncbi:helicase SNF [Paenibacillus swuensis]|uniref:Helicase SNF n=1 Tax=Paenibacillus swuensis TaxID=1178515 RepID=A0A172TKY2_9BACL|nr:SNF2 helicase associated domain-containing protein [Paenibacillus swuensis]ANE47698.1 helicase SNF [Paenibacillus swuensis]